MKAVGVRVFVGGLYPARGAKSLRMHASGEVPTNDGPYLETTEHLGELWITGGC